jgi:Tfp pilus assembly protein PilX
MSNQILKRARLNDDRRDESGAALAIALIVMVLLFAITISVLATVTTEIGVARTDLSEKPAFYAAISGIEKMKNRILDHFASTSRPPTSEDLKEISGEADPETAGPKELRDEGYSFSQSVTENTEYIKKLKATGYYGNGAYPLVKIGASSPLGGLYGSLSSYKLTSKATHDITNTTVSVEQTVNSYLIPLFQFGIFSNNDLEIYPGPKFTFNGRVHTNGNLYTNGESLLSFQNKVTYVGNHYRPSSSDPTKQTEGLLRNGNKRLGSATFDQAPQQLQKPLNLPVQNKYPAREIIKRGLEADYADDLLETSRYHNKAQIRILIDDEETDVSYDISDSVGVKLSEFVPMQLGVGSGTVLNRIDDNGQFINGSRYLQVRPDERDSSKKSVSKDVTATTVRSTMATSHSSGSLFIPRGAGLKGRIRIEIVSSTGYVKDVTKAILSMGVTEGEPNGIVYLQRPLWAAFTQGSRDRYANSDRNNCLTNLINNTDFVADGEINNFSLSGIGTLNTNSSKLDDDTDSINIGGTVISGEKVRFDDPTYNPTNPSSPRWWNEIVPINVYNVREGWLHSNMERKAIYERGMTNVIELNMKNLARWVDGVFDSSLLAGTGAESSNIEGRNGYVVYISDRRGDKNRNGIVDNEDIYGKPSDSSPTDSYTNDRWIGGTFEKEGEDVTQDGIFQNDKSELPDPYIIFGGKSPIDRAKEVARWKNENRYFRNAVRLFNGEILQTTGAENKLSSTKGITIATENMIYIWGSYNTTGITKDPGSQSTLSNGYYGAQIPASIVADAFFPLSKTWFDSYSAIYPEGGRTADEGASITDETSVRAGIIAGNTMSAYKGTPDVGNGFESRLNGGMQNYPRFLEVWAGKRWNYIGSFIPLFYSTQALGQYNTTHGTIYSPPIRNWAFDISFEDPSRIPPGTPSLQYIEVTSFKQLNK